MLNENSKPKGRKKNDGWDKSKAQKEFPITRDFIIDEKRTGKVNREELKKNAFVVFQKELFVKKFLEKKSAFGYDNGTSAEEIKSKLEINEKDIKDPSKPFDEFVKQIEKKAKEPSSGA